MKVEGPVYVVDDDDAVRDSLAMLLEASGLRVEAFAAAAEVLVRCRDERPACVITDVRMPEMDGLQLQERLASCTRLRSCYHRPCDVPLPSRR